MRSRWVYGRRLEYSEQELLLEFSRKSFYEGLTLSIYMEEVLSYIDTLLKDREISGGFSF
jgi:hypothetical protein